jgi:hypothetical protein
MAMHVFYPLEYFSILSNLGYAISILSSDTTKLTFNSIPYYWF